MPNECEEIRDLLERYVARKLDLPLRQEVERHIAKCAACRKELLFAAALAQSIHEREAEGEGYHLDTETLVELAANPGELNPARRREAFRHIACCNQCAEYYQLAGGVAHDWQMIDGAGLHEKEGFMARLGTWLTRPMAPGWLFPAAAALIVFIVLSSRIYRGTDLPPGPSATHLEYADSLERSAGARLAAISYQVRVAEDSLRMLENAIRDTEGARTAMLVRTDSLVHQANDELEGLRTEIAQAQDRMETLDLRLAQADLPQPTTGLRQAADDTTRASERQTAPSGTKRKSVPRLFTLGEGTVVSFPGDLSAAISTTPTEVSPKSPGDSLYLIIDRPGNLVDVPSAYLSVISLRDSADRDEVHLGELQLPDGAGPILIPVPAGILWEGRYILMVQAPADDAVQTVPVNAYHLILRPENNQGR